jgi:hypothetical protein
LIPLGNSDFALEGIATAVTLPGRFFTIFAILLAPILSGVAGCGVMVAANSSNSTFSISPGTATIDTSCTGCNARNAQDTSVYQFKAALASGGAASVTWSVVGGDAASGPGTISANGQYSPPSYLTADQVEVVVTARLAANPAVEASAIVTVTPGFLQPLTPENLALGASGSVRITGFLAEAGGTAAIDFSLSESPIGAGAGLDSRGNLGSLGPVNCRRDSYVFTSCTVAYTAPAAIPANGVVYVVANLGALRARTSTALLLNSTGIISNPSAHQEEMPVAMHLGSSGGNNNDFDLSGSRIADCCSGTLGALIEGPGNRLYLLSNNHVLARSDQASVGDAIVQPGLIDNNCTPNGIGPGVEAIATLNGWLPLGAKSTNVDAAIAQVSARAVDTSGGILEFGSKQLDGTLAAAPPGISSSGGRGEAAQLSLKIAKSGRTTGLTCGSLTALDLDVVVDYYLDCAETKPYLTKTFTNQLAVSGNAFSDAGDSGSLLVDAANAEPVGLFFAGGIDSAGVSQGVANPAPEVLAELGSGLSNSANAFTFVGAADHPVSCLSYGDNTIDAAQARVLSTAEYLRGREALAEARVLENPSAGILGTAQGKSSDLPGEAAVIIYVDENKNPVVPDSIGGVRTVVIGSPASDVASGSAAKVPFPSGSAAPSLPVSALDQAIAVKQQIAAEILHQNPAFFAVGVGQSLDNPREAALVIYADRLQVPAQLPQSLGGLRTRYVIMERLHVTRSYAAPSASHTHCMPKAPQAEPSATGQLDLFRPRIRD